MTKAIYRRVPVLIREARDGQAEENPWGIRFSAMFHMANDSHRFHTRERLEADGWQLAGNVFRKGGLEYLPLYEAKMIHQFDHRWASYRIEGGKTVSTNVPLPDKQNPAYAALPRYWVEAREVHERIAKLPGPLESPSSLPLSQTLCDGDADSLHSVDSFFLDPTRSLLGRLPAVATSSGVCSSAETEPSDLAGTDLRQARSRWLMGWRDITRSVEKRTTIAAIIPVTAVGHQFLLMFPDTSARLAAALLGSLNSFVFDFVARQKISRIHLPFFTMNQTAVLPPDTYSDAILEFMVPRVLELLYTGEDLRGFARDCGWDGPPFRWDEERRFLLRCELDAAFFHLYLPPDANGGWRPVRRTDKCPHDQTPEQLAELKRSFPTPRDAVASIMDTFAIVRRKDEGKHGEYRTKRVILEIYDEMQESVVTGESYKARLHPPPADTSCCHTPLGKV